MNALYLTVIAFAVGLLGGSTIAVIAKIRGDSPKLLALAHGTVNTAGLVLAVVAIARGTSGPIVWALVVLALSAMLGFAVYSNHRRGRGFPFPTVVGHGAMGALGFVLVALNLFE